jgi:hypothetical protein
MAFRTARPLGITLLGPMALVVLVALGATSPSSARTRHTATTHHAPSPHKVRADANGYFFFPANYSDDYYVYDPRAAHTRVRKR